MYSTLLWGSLWTKRGRTVQKCTCENVYAAVRSADLTGFELCKCIPAGLLVCSETECLIEPHDILV